MFVHLNDYQEAHDLILSHPGHTEDPWLLSAEIALAGVRNKPSKNMRRAIRMVESNSYGPKNITELAAATATFELSGGDIKSAKHLYRRSLISPNDNSVAQVEWARQLYNSIDPAKALDSSFEAMAWRARASKDWSGVVRFCHEWLNREPYSERPALLGGYYADIASHDSKEMVAISMQGLMANPKSLALLNNTAVGLAYLGQLSMAMTHIEKAIRLMRTQDKKEVAIHAPFLRATLGLIALRSGCAEIGERLYIRSFEEFIDNKERAAGLMAGLYWIREDIRLGRKESERLLDVVRKSAKGLPLPIYNDIIAQADGIEKEALQKPLPHFFSRTDLEKTEARIIKADNDLQAVARTDLPKNPAQRLSELITKSSYK